jgi:hypothetical protein
VVWSFVYLALRRSLELILLCFRIVTVTRRRLLSGLPAPDLGDRCGPKLHGMQGVRDSHALKLHAGSKPSSGPLRPVGLD